MYYIMSVHLYEKLYLFCTAGFCKYLLESAEQVQERSKVMHDYDFKGMCMCVHNRSRVFGGNDLD